MDVKKKKTINKYERNLNKVGDNMQERLGLIWLRTGYAEYRISCKVDSCIPITNRKILPYRFILRKNIAI